MDRYFDNAATTPLDPRVLDAMMPYLTEGFGNANSIHALGRQARQGVELARAELAQALGLADAEMIVFTSGATEGNNWVLKSFKRAAVSPFEHSSVYEPARALGYEILGNDGLRLLAPAERVDLVSVMAVNNEIGSRLDYLSMRDSCQKLHVDITQAAAKYPVDLADVDFATLSAHKFYGPKGVGALIAKDFLPPMLHGGEHEGGLRAGTLNVAGIVGLGRAAHLAVESREADMANLTSLRETVLDGLSGTPDFEINGGLNVAPHILNISFLGVMGEAIVLELDVAGFAISSGAACSSGSTEPSHVLSALGIEPEWLRGSVRISFGRFNTLGAAQELGSAIRRAVAALRSLKT